jgi:hypothetical protein
MKLFTKVSLATVALLSSLVLLTSQAYADVVAASNTYYWRGSGPGSGNGRAVQIIRGINTKDAPYCRLWADAGPPLGCWTSYGGDWGSDQVFTNANVAVDSLMARMTAKAASQMIGDAHLLASSASCIDMMYASPSTREAYGWKTWWPRSYRYYCYKWEVWTFMPQ